MTGLELLEMATFCRRECEDTPIMILGLLEQLASKVCELEDRIYALEVPADMPTVPF